MGLLRTTQPAIEPVTIAEALVHLRADSGPEDALITLFITAAREHCEHSTERTLINSKWTLVLDCFPCAIELLNPPLVGIDSIKFLDVDGIQQTLNPADYIVDTANSQVSYAVPSVEKAWPATQSRINAVEVVYTAGYGATAADVPAMLRAWILLAVAELYKNREMTSDKPALPLDFQGGLIRSFRILGV